MTEKETEFIKAGNQMSKWFQVLRVIAILGFILLIGCLIEAPMEGTGERTRWHFITGVAMSVTIGGGFCSMLTWWVSRLFFSFAKRQSILR